MGSSVKSQLLDDLPEKNSQLLSKRVNNILKVIVVIAGFITVISGVLVMSGWIFGLNFLKGPDPSSISMKANTAICFVMLGGSLLLRKFFRESRKMAIVTRVFILITIAVSLFTLLEYITGWNPGIDGWLFKDVSQSNRELFPGRMAFNTSICLLFLGIALIYVEREATSLIYLSQILPLLTALLSMIIVLGYMYNSNGLFTIAFFNQMSLYSTITLLILSTGIICYPHSAGFLSILTVKGPGGYMARRLLPLTIFLPILFVWLRLISDKGESKSGSADVLIISFLYIVIFAFFIWRIARSVNNIDKDRIFIHNELKQSEQRFYLAFHSSPAALIITTLDEGKVLDMNEAYCNMVGISEKGLRGYKMTSLNLWEDPSEREKMLAELMAKGKIHNLEIHLHTGSGDVCTALASFELLKLYGEDCIISSAIDITEWKLAQEIIKVGERQNLLANEILEHLNRNTDSEVMINSIINSIRAKTGYEAVAIRIKEGEDFPYYATSGFSDAFVAAERLLCTRDSRGNIIRDKNNEPLLECMCGNILCGRIDTSKSFFTEGGSFRSNNTTSLLKTTTDTDRMTRTRNRCNSSGYESVALIPLRSGSEIIGLLQLNDHRTDIFNDSIIPFFERLGSSIGMAIMRNKAENELKELNKELESRVIERTEQLLDSNKELESFAYSVSHDLRAPLRHVIGFSEILEMELGDKNGPEVQRLTGTIKNSARKMSMLIDELLSYSRLGRTNLKRVPLSLNNIIDDVIAEAVDLTNKREINWKISKLPEVKADPMLIRLVFQNLINNSIKFTGKKENPVIEISFEDNKKAEYTFWIKDNGAGFSMDYANKLFGVFQRLHKEEEYEGTGIGLAIVRRIIRRHNGSVWAQGEPDEGATFYFTLPKPSQVS
jgi:PAS domain S-box-containing protein